MATIKCAHCGKRAKRRAIDVTRAASAGLNIYCNRRCAGLGRRCGKTKAQKVAEKAAYDRDYRKKNIIMLKAKKADYFKRTYDPVAAAVERKKHMARHVEYCRRPEYRAKKSVYDRQHRAEKFFGPFAEVAMLTTDLNREIKGRMSNYEIRRQNETGNKAQERDRQAQGQKRDDTDRRPRDRRDRSSAPLG